MPTVPDYLELIASGLPASSSPRKVVVVGAGVLRPGGSL